MQPLTRRSWSLKLSGPENQAIRYLIHSCQRSCVAIGECPDPFLEEIIPLASEYPSILSALLALSARLRVSSGDQACPSHPATGGGASADTPSRWEGEALDRHQETIAKVQSALSRLQSGNHVSNGDAMQVLGSCLLLALFGFPEQVHNWSVHVAGMIALIDTLEMEGLRPVSLVRHVRAVAAHLDIAAFALNRPEASQHKWLVWGIRPLMGEDGDWNCVPADGLKMFTPFEVSSGYPESLVTVIALVSAVVEDLTSAGTVADDSVAGYIQDVYQNIRRPDVLPGPVDYFAASPPQDSPQVYWTSRLQAIIAWWEAPSIPPHISRGLSLALTTAWEIIRKAAHIYLSRGGFTTSIYTPRSPNQERMTRKFLPDMIVGLQSLISLAETQEITIANAMIWPLTVIGNEICDDGLLQAELVILFQRLQTYFRIAHCSHILDLLQELWHRFADSTVMSASPASPRDLSLQLLAAERNLSIPLF